MTENQMRFPRLSIATQRGIRVYNTVRVPAADRGHQPAARGAVLLLSADEVEVS